MELINTKDLYENDAFVIIEAEFEDSETQKANAGNFAGT